MPHYWVVVLCPIPNTKNTIHETLCISRLKSWTLLMFLIYLPSWSSHFGTVGEILVIQTLWGFSTIPKALEARVMGGKMALAMGWWVSGPFLNGNYHQIMGFSTKNAFYSRLNNLLRLNLSFFPPPLQEPQPKQACWIIFEVFLFSLLEFFEILFLLKNCINIFKL